MSANSQYIASLCQTLAEQGRQISVAMIRSKADRSLSIPEVVTVLKQWKQDPHQFKDADDVHATNKSAEPLNLEQRVDELEKQVLLLTKQLQELRLK